MAAERELAALVPGARAAAAAAASDYEKALAEARETLLRLVTERLDVLRAADAQLVAALDEMDARFDRLTRWLFDRVRRYGDVPAKFDLRGVGGERPARAGEEFRNPLPSFLPPMWPPAHRVTDAEDVPPGAERL
jgi:hypothetical protein